MEPTEESLSQEQSQVNLRHHWEIVVKRKVVILTVFAAAVLGTLAYNLKQVPIYQASASVVIESLSPRVLSNVEEVVPLGTGTYWSSKEFYETEYKILQSRVIAEQVVRKLGLDKDLEFLGLAELAANNDAEALNRALQKAQPAEAVLSKVSIVPVKDSKMAVIQYRDRDPARAAQLANVHAQTYIEYNLERKLEGTKTAAQWLSEQLGDLNGKLEQSEIALYAFKKDNAILAQSLGDKTDLLRKNIEDTSHQLREVRAKRVTLGARIAETQRARSGVGRDALPEVVQNESIQSMRRMQVELTRDLVQLTQRYGDKHPKLLEVREQRDKIEEAVTREIDKILSAVETEHRIAVATEEKLQALLGEAQVESLELNKKSIDYNKLLRENENNTRLYGVVMSRLKDADLTGLLRTNNVRMVDQAETPRLPIFPKTRTNVLLAAIMGLIAGLALAFLLDYIDSTVKSQEDVAKLGLTFLGIVPHFNRQSDGKRVALDDRARDFFVFENQRSQVAECSRTIRTNLMFMDTDKPIRRLLVVSAQPEEGKTSNAINLATTMALSGVRTLLVDTDMRRPRLHRVFGFGSELGLSSFLLGERSLEDVTKRTVIPGLDLLPCGATPPAPAELLHTEKFRRMLDELSTRYDRIIFDSPPVVAVTDGVILSSLCDGVIMVIKAGHTPRDLVRQAISNLRAANANIIGVVVNDIDLASRTYGYYYGYYRQYGSYTSEAPIPVSKG